VNLQDVKSGLIVKTVTELGDTRGMFITPMCLERRRPNAVGTTLHWVPGHGGDVWWVKHEDGQVAPYVFNEFELAEQETVKNGVNMEGMTQKKKIHYALSLATEPLLAADLSVITGIHMQSLTTTLKKMVDAKEIKRTNKNGGSWLYSKL
jgi:hypothetical protein